MIRPCLARVLLPLWLLSALWGTAPVRADTLEDAQAHFERAVQLYQERAYDEALVEFQRAHDIAPRYQVLFNIGQVHYQLNEYAEAQRSFERYLREGGREIPAARRQQVERSLAELRERVGTLVVTSEPAGASVILDGVELGVTPLRTAVDIGRHLVRIERAGTLPVERRVQMASGEEARLEVSLGAQERAEAPAPPRVTVSTPHPGRRPALWTLGSASLALAAGAGAALGLAARANGELSEALRSVPADGDEVDGARARVRRAALASDVLGASALAAAAGFVLTLALTRTPRGERAEPSAQLDVGLGRLGVRGVF